MMDYEQLIARKSAAIAASGFLVPEEDLAPHLFPHQRDLTRWALRRGRAAVFADTGLGKCPILLEWARHVSPYGRVLILAPLAVGQQIEREGVKFGVDARYVRADDPAQRIVIANYEMLHAFDPSLFIGVVLDECFAADTMVDTPLGRRQISTLRIGDRIVNASGVDTVSDVHRREVPYAVKVSYGGASCIASPNHPFFTQRGWVGARTLRAGDHVFQTAAAVRLVLEGIRPDFGPAIRHGAEVLRAILFSEMADASTGDRSEGPQRGGSSEAGGDPIGMMADPSSSRSTRTDRSTESEHGSDSTREDFPPIERDEARTFRAWWQRSGLDEASISASGCTWTDMGNGMVYITGPTDAGLPNELQARLGAARSEARDRIGWVLPPLTQGAGPQERRDAGFIRVDGIEILEPGHYELDRYRDADGKLYFYDIGGTRHPSFSINGALVHNSSILKSFDGKTKQRLIEAFRDAPYKLCCTATPAPNDFTELGNHSEFLGIKTRAEMLAEFFVHDGGSTQDWRIKGHAVKPFWRWVATWGAVVKMPSDLGYPDGAFKLPPINMVEHVVSAGTHDIATSGQLFALQARSLHEQRAVKRATIETRASKISEIIGRATPGEQFVVWCDLNDEQDAVADAIGKSCVSIEGATSDEEKITRHDTWLRGEVQTLVTKSVLFGWGLNWQHCHREIFAGPSNSYERTYQAIRRTWRFGQQHEVTIDIVRSELEEAVLDNYRRKEADAAKMAAEMTAHVGDAVRAEVRGLSREFNDYNPQRIMEIPSWLK